jgi:hypothetical protein
MKEWQVTLGGAVVMFVAGMIMFLWANSLAIPTTVQFSGYVLISDQYFSTSQAGALFTGFGGGLLICTLLIYQLEQKLESK